jgi:predicted dehydrogenase
MNSLKRNKAVATPESRILRVAIVGCGQIADAHIQEVAKIQGGVVAAVCDREADLAYQAAARFGVPRQYDDFDRMLSELRPDVVHLTTPPHTHFALASKSIRSGAHVYVEKPFALNADETKRLLELATTERRLVCVGHDHVFDPIWKECLTAVAQDRLGEIAHVDSQQGYDPRGPFGRLIQTDPDHWIHRLPGGIFQNVISHAVCKVTPFVTDEHPAVAAMAFGSPDVCVLPTELRVLVRGGNTSATITILSRVRPVQRVVRIYGTKSGLEVDFDAGIIRYIRAAQLPGALGRIEIPVRQALEAARNAGRALRKFAGSELQYFAGMRALFEAFYSAIRTGGPPPIAYDEIQRVANIMDDIFEQTPCGSAWIPPVHAVRREDGVTT